MEKQFLLFIATLFFCISIKGQNRDSLIHELHLASSDSARVEQLLALSKSYQRVDSIFHYSNGALQIVDSIRNPLQYAKILEALSIVEYRKLKYLNSIRYQKQAMAINMTHANEAGQARNASKIATCYFSMRKFELAKSWQFKAIKKYNLLNDSIDICEPYLGLGNIYQLASDVDSSIYYYNLSLKSSERSKKHLGNSATVLGNLAGLYLRYGQDFEKAIEFSEKAIQVGEELGRKDIIVTNLNLLGAAYMASENNEEAITILKNAIQLNTNVNLNSLVHSYNNLGVIYKRQKKYASALKCYQFMLRKTPESHRHYAFLMQNIGNAFANIGELDSAFFYLQKVEGRLDQKSTIHEQSTSYFALAKVYEKRNYFSRANKYLHKTLTARDSLFTKENAKSLQDAYAKYENQLQRDSTARAMAETALVKKDAFLQRSWKWFFVALTFLLGILSTSFYKNYLNYQVNQRIIEQENQRLAKENSSVEEKLKSIKGLMQSLEFLDKTPIFINGHKILLGDITYLKAEDKTVVVYTKSGRIRYLGNLKGLHTKLPEAIFVQSHKSYIINITEIQSQFAQRLIMSNDDEVRIGRAFKGQFLNKFKTYTQSQSQLQSTT